AKTGEPGEWIEIDLGAMKHIKAIQLNYYDHKSVQHNRANDLYYQYRIYSSDNGTDWTLAVDKSDNDKDVPHDYIELGETLDARYLKL
ncbi:discoidin domain-containing protein, partial [Lactococcus lactis]